MTNVIVSYSRKDSTVARKLIEAFKAIDLDVWVDWEDIPPAVGWLDQILRGIEESDAFIFLVSPDSIASEVCKVEIGHAAKNNKRIIPILIRDVNAKEVIETIRDLNWIHGREADNFDECLEKIKLAIELDIEWVGEHKRLQVRALEWDRKKDMSLLLRGRDLRYAHTMVRSATGKNPPPTELQHIYIKHSHRNQRLSYSFWISTAIAIVIMIGLSLTAIAQARRAEANRAEALTQKHQADLNAASAKQNEKRARAAEADALENANLANAQRSAAKAQIYQTRPGELYTSTLFAVDSWQRHESSEAEEILRQNITLLPIPVEQMAQGDRINALQFSPDERSFLTASADKSVCAWNLEDGQRLFCATSSASVNDAAFSLNGELIATGDQSGHIMILDAKDGSVKKEFDLQASTIIWDVNISPSGRFLAVTREDAKITFYDLHTPDYKFGFELVGPGSLRVSAFSPDGRWFAAGSTEGSITIWDLQSNKVLKGPAHHAEVLSLEFSPNSRTLVSGGADSVALVTQTSSGQELFRILNEDWVEDIAFSPDSSWFVTASDDHRIRVWDTKSGKEKLRMLQDSFVTKVTVSSNGRWIATTGADQTIRLWNAATGAQIFQIPLDASGSALNFSSDDQYLVSGDARGNIDIWNLSSMIAATNYALFSGFTGELQFSPTDDWLAASDENRIWLLDKGEFSMLTTSLPNSPDLRLKSNVKDMLVSPDSKWIGITTETGELYLYNVQSKERRIITQSTPAPNFVFSPDSSQIITAGADGKVQTWDVSSGKLESTLLEGAVGDMSLAMGENLLAVGVSEKILIWDLGTGQLNSEVAAAGEHPFLVFSPNANLLVAGNSFGQINIWRQSGDGFEASQPINTGHINSMVFNPGGDQLLVGGDSLLYVFDPLTGAEVSRIPHKDAVKGISFSPDGSILATASWKVIQLWEVGNIPIIRSDQLVETACTRLIRNFDQGQWASFFPKEDYRKLCEKLDE